MCVLLCVLVCVCVVVTEAAGGGGGGEARDTEKCNPVSKWQKNDLLLDVWGWFIITTAAGIAAAAKNFATQALHGNSPRSNIKIRLSKILLELNKYVTMR